MRDAVPPCEMRYRGETGTGRRNRPRCRPGCPRRSPRPIPPRPTPRRTRRRPEQTVTAGPRAPTPSMTPSHKADAGRAPERSSRGAIPRPCSAAAARGGPAPHRRTGILRRMGRMGSGLGGPGRGRVRICHKGVSRRDRPRAEARNINDSLSALRRDGGLCNRFGQTAPPRAPGGAPRVGLRSRGAPPRGRARRDAGRGGTIESTPPGGRRRGPRRRPRTGTPPASRRERLTTPHGSGPSPHRSPGKSEQTPAE